MAAAESTRTARVGKAMPSVSISKPYISTALPATFNTLANIIILSGKTVLPIERKTAAPAL